MSAPAHDDLCPCSRFRTQPAFCTCGAVDPDGRGTVSGMKAKEMRIGQRMSERRMTTDLDWIHGLRPETEAAHMSGLFHIN